MTTDKSREAFEAWRKRWIENKDDLTQQMFALSWDAVKLRDKLWLEFLSSDEESRRGFAACIEFVDMIVPALELLPSRLTTLLTGLRGLRDEWQRMADWMTPEDPPGYQSGRIGQLKYDIAALDTLVRTVEGE